MHRRIILALLILIAAASLGVSALDDDNQYYTHYDEDFKEGKSLSIELSVLDKVIFTYYGTNYTFGVMSIGQESSMIRVEKKGREVLIGQSLYFDIDDEYDQDLTVTFVSSDSDTGMYKLDLYIRPGDTPQQNNTANNTTNNSTNTNSTNNSANNTTTSSNTNSSTSTSNNAQTNTASANSQQTTNNQQQAQQTTQNQTANPIQTQTSPTGATIVNVNFNITLPQGSGIGLLIVIAIVLGGLLAYKKLRKKIDK